LSVQVNPTRIPREFICLFRFVLYRFLFPNLIALAGWRPALFELRRA